MTSRILPPAEWPKLAGTEAETLWPYLDPETARVLVVEQDGQIVGCWTAYPVLHVECLWIADAHRGKGSVARRLWAGMKRLVAEMGANAVMTAARDEAVRGLLQHAGAVQVPGEHYVIRMRE